MNMNDFKAYKSNNTINYQFFFLIELKYFPSDNLALKATTGGRAGRASGAFLNFSVSAGRVTCEDGGSYQCKISHTGANNESLTVTSASVNVAVVGKTHSFCFVTAQHRNCYNQQLNCYKKNTQSLTYTENSNRKNIKVLEACKLTLSHNTKIFYLR